MNGAVLRVTFKDAGGNYTTRSFELAAAEYAGTVLISEIEASAQALVASLQAVSDCAISAFEVALKGAASSPTTAGENVEIENTAALSLPLVEDPPTGITPFGILNIPGPKIGIFEGTSGLSRNIVDLADADVLEVIDYFQAGATNQFTLSDGQLVAATLGGDASGWRVHRRSKRSRGRRIG